MEYYLASFQVLYKGKPLTTFQRLVKASSIMQARSKASDWFQSSNSNKQEGLLDYEVEVFEALE